MVLLSVARVFMMALFMSQPPVNQDFSFDLEASEVICKKTESGERYFTYVISNVGSQTAPEGSYMVFFKVNGKMVSFETVTSPLEPGKSIVYTSEEKFNVSKKRRLKYHLIVKTEDGNKDNNRKKGEIIL
jgi:hypothetical protein